MCNCIGAGTTQGYLAYRAGKVVGWCNAGPWTLYPMLTGTPAAGPGLATIMCFVVAPQCRGQGVATQLLAAVCDGLKGSGSHAVAARSRPGSTSAAENHHGPLAMYLAAGFEVIGDGDHGTVMVEKVLVRDAP